MKVRVVRELSHPSTDRRFWFPDITDDLVASTQENLTNLFGINAFNYGTNRIASKNPIAPREVVVSLRSSAEKEFCQKAIQIEILPKPLQDRYSGEEIRFYKKPEIVKDTIVDCLFQAFDTVELVPSLSNSVFTIVRSLHLIKTRNIEMDVSFSEPSIPFSIFVSVPQKRVHADYLRVAEALVHESMHLQLSLMEHVIPLVSSSHKMFFSPWRKEFRNSLGILHAIYVFSVINSFYQKLIDEGGFSKSDAEFIEKRRKEISAQLRKSSEFQRDLELTSAGHTLTELLFEELI